MAKKNACKTLTCKKDLDEATKAKEGTFVLFYATWCPFSRAFLPSFLESAEGCPTAHAHLALDDVEELADEYSIEVYPTVLFFKDGKVVKRLDGVYHVGLDGGKLKAFISSCGK